MRWVGPLGRGRRGILSFIGRHLRSSVPPSMQRVYRTANVGSASAIRTCLGQLRSRKCVSHHDNLGHTVHLPNRDIAHIPLLNGIATNVPVLTIRRIRSCIPFSNNDRCRSNRLFTLQIANADVVGTNVLSQSIIVIGHAGATRGNSVIITLVRSRTAIGHVCVRGSRVHLRPRGSTFRPVVIGRTTILNGIISLIQCFK